MNQEFDFRKQNGFRPFGGIAGNWGEFRKSDCGIWESRGGFPEGAAMEKLLERFRKSWLDSALSEPD